MRDEIPTPSYVCVAQSNALDVRTAVWESAAQISLDDTCFIVVFVPGHLDLDSLAVELNAALNGVPVFGCTTAGQITLKGYEEDALLLLAFPKAHFCCCPVLLGPLNPLSITTIAADAEKQSSRFLHRAGWNRFALFFADGLSKQEDLLVSTLETVLDGLPVFGGSAGDALAFEQTFVLHGGQFHTNAALLLLIETKLRFQGLGFDHFLPTDSQLIVTAADPEERLVYEINGAPATEEYARLVGCREQDLSPQIFAENPLLVRHNMEYYVRAISDARPDRTLSFLAAIDDGLVMTIGRGKEIIETLEAELNIADSHGQAPDFILGFDCVLRKLEIEHKQLKQPVSEIFRQRHVLGFNTYGEQHCGLHVNQTFVGIAFFEPEERHRS